MAVVACCRANLVEQIVLPKRDGTMSGVAVNDLREGWSHGCTVVERFFLVTTTSASAQRPQMSSKESVLGLSRPYMEFDSSDRGAACQPEFTPACTAPNGGHHVAGFEDQMMGVHRNGCMSLVTSHRHKQKTRFSADRMA